MLLLLPSPLTIAVTSQRHFCQVSVFVHTSLNFMVAENGDHAETNRLPTFHSRRGLSAVRHIRRKVNTVDTDQLHTMETGGVTRPLHVLLMGPPGVGKTTVCKKIVSKLEKMGSRFDGFYTEEVRNKSGSRIGFDIIGTKDSGKRLPLARLKSLTEGQKASKYQVGNYHVFLDNFETIALPILDLDNDVLLIDEIGRMELFSKEFKKKVADIFFGSSKKAFVIGTMPQMHKVPQQHAALFEKLHADKKNKILNITRENRNNMPEEIISYFL